jgi:hypothetical protein
VNPSAVLFTNSSTNIASKQSNEEKRRKKKGVTLPNGQKKKVSQKNKVSVKKQKNMHSMLHLFCSLVGPTKDRHLIA